jgi:hypothetical protein
MNSDAKRSSGPGCRILRGVASIVIVLGLLLPQMARGQDSTDASKLLAAVLRKKLNGYIAQALNPKKNVRTRDLSSGALLSLLTGDDSHLAETFLRKVYATQEMDPTSKVFGEVRWIVTDKAVDDLNAIEFNCLSLGPVLLQFGPELSPEFKEYFQPHLAAALAGLANHHVKPTYTNICLMNAVCQMLLGQAAGDGAAIRQAEGHLDDWIAYTRKYGVHEFDSPTYYGVDLNVLTIGYRYAESPADRAKFKTALDYFWTDISANYFPEAQKITGGFSRDYDFLAGTGDLDKWLASVNWAPTESFSDVPVGSTLESVIVNDMDGVFLLDNLRSGGYRPPAGIIALAHIELREVDSSCDEVVAHARWNWIGQSVAMGCTSGYYGEQDKLFSATFAGRRDLPQITLVVDGRDAPYGSYKIADRTNHLKPVHLPANLACVQSGSTVLLTVDVDAGKIPDYATSLTTNLVLPSEGEIKVDGQRVHLEPPGTVELRPDVVVTIAEGGGVVGIRMVAALRDAGRTPSWSLAADADGLAHHAVRLRLSQLPDELLRTPSHVRSAFIVAAADGDRAGALADELGRATVDQKLDRQTWHVAVQLPNLSLEVDRSATARDRITSQLINGMEIQPAVLGLNGKDLAAPVWAELQQ